MIGRGDRNQAPSSKKTTIYERFSVFQASPACTGFAGCRLRRRFDRRPHARGRSAGVELGYDRRAERPVGFRRRVADAEIVLDFTAALDAATVEANIYLLDAGGAKVDASDVYDGAKRVTLKPSAGLNAYASYRLIVDSGLKSAAGEAILTGKVIRIRTGLDTSDKFPQISGRGAAHQGAAADLPLFLGGCRIDERHGARAHLVGRDGHYRRDGLRRDGHDGGRRARFRDPQRGVPAGAADRDLPCGAGDLLSRRLLALDRRPDGADASLLGR